MREVQIVIRNAGRFRFSNEPIKPDDVVDIKVIESDGMTESAIMTDIANIKSPISKLESFYKLEALLKKRGLL